LTPEPGGVPGTGGTPATGCATRRAARCASSPARPGRG